MIVYAAMQFIFAPLIGNLSDRFGRRPILLVSIITFAFDNLICALATSYWMLFVGRVFAGASGASFATCSAYIADISDDKTRTRNFGLIGIAFGVGFILGPLFGGLLGAFGPRTPFYAAAILSFLNFIFAWAFLPETLGKRHRRRFDIKRANPFGAMKEMRKYPSVLWVMLAFFLYWMAAAIWPAVWPYIAEARYNWNSVAIAVSYATFGIGQIFVMGILLPRLVLRWSDRRISLTGLISAAIGLVGYALAVQGWMVYLVFALTFLEYLAHAPMRSIAASQVPPSGQGELQGALTSITSITTILGPEIYTRLFRAGTAQDAAVPFAGLPFIVALVFVSLSLIVLYFFVRPPETTTSMSTYHS